MAKNRIGKTELISLISDKTCIAKKDVTAIMNATEEIVTDAMKKDDKIVIPGFCSVEVQKVKARMGRNIQTGEPLKIPAHKRVKFTAGKTLADSVAKK